MAWPERHPDGAWPRLAAGLLAPGERADLAAHARTCARCATQYERAVGLHRALDGRDAFAPLEDEVAQFEHAGLERALAAARPKRIWAWWTPQLGGALAAGLAVLLLTVLFKPRPPPVGEIQWRGSADAHVQLRAFCAPSGQPMVELHEGGSCPPGGVLAFAASAPEKQSTALVRFRGADRTTLSDPLTVNGRPGSERPLDYTPRLDLPAGPAVIEVGFGANAVEAQSALEGTGERRTIHLTVGTQP